MLRVIARHADRANFFSADAEEFRATCAALRAACDEEGRDAAAIEPTWSCSGVVIGADAGERDEIVRRVRDSGSPSAAFLHVMATPDEAVRLLEGFAEAGAGEVMLQFADFPGERSIEAFAAKVMPRLAG